MLAESFIPFSIGLPESGVEENLEGDYFDELRSPEIIMNDDVHINESDMSNDADELTITNPAVARLFGIRNSEYSIGGYQTYGREQRGSMTKETDTFSEIDSYGCIRGDPG